MDGTSGGGMETSRLTVARAGEFASCYRVNLAEAGGESDEPGLVLLGRRAGCSGSAGSESELQKGRR
jgi:hypothetical protein